MADNTAAPPARVLDGPDPYVGHRADQYGPHGYLVITLRDTSLLETFYEADGTKLDEWELTI